jgi:hypothetical protein
MKTTKFITGLFLCGSIFAACNSDDDDHRNGVQSGDPAEVTVSITNRGTYGLTGTAEVGTPDENKISKIEIFVFDENGKIDTKTATGNGYFTANVPQGTNSFRYTVIMNSGNKKKLVAAVNMTLGALPAGHNYDSLKLKLSTAQFEASLAGGHNTRTIPTNGFEMSGEVVVNVASGTANSVHIPVSRLVSKINAPRFTSTGNVNTAVSLTQQEIEKLWGVGAQVPNITFKGLGYVLANGLSKSSVLFNGRLADNDDTGSGKDVKPWVDWRWTGKTYLKSSFLTTPAGKYSNTYSGPSASGDWFLATSGVAGEERVYAYENKPRLISLNGQLGFDPATVYAFIIKGELVVDGDALNTNGKNKTRYWRIDLVKDSNFHILRNNSYYVYLKTIVSIGFPTEKEAEEDPDIIPPDANDTSAQIELVVNQWRINQYETEI